MEKIDITMTAVLRPEIIKGTLESFCQNLFVGDRDRYRLIINVDPVGEKVKPEKIVKTCRPYFDNIVYNISSEPSFPKAVIWTWKQVEANYVFHLEDDWQINKFIDINHMISILEKRKDIACLRLYKEKMPNNKTPVIFGSRYQYFDDGFFVAQDRKKQFGLNPVLIKGSFVKEAVPLMVDYKNPEKQFRYGNELMRDFVMKWKYAIYGKPGDPIMVWGKRGLYWRKKSNWKKPRDGGQFLTWVSRKENP